MTSFKFLWNKLIYINYHLSWTSCNQSQSLNEMWGRYHFKVYLIQQVSRYMALFTLWSVWSSDKISIWPLLCFLVCRDLLRLALITVQSDKVGSPCTAPCSSVSTWPGCQLLSVVTPIDFHSSPQVKLSRVFLGRW